MQVNMFQIKRENIKETIKLDRLVKFQLVE